MQKIILGLDISKNKIDCCLFQNDKFDFIEIENNQAGFDSLLTFFKNKDIDLKNIYACCEATNVYYLHIAHFLLNQNIQISVVNPLVIQYFAKLQLKKVKTDKQDSKMIALYCLNYQPKSWKPNSDKAVKLQNLYRRTEQIKQMIIMETNRLSVSECDFSVNRVLDFLKMELDQCQN